MKINRSGRHSESTSAEVLRGWDAHEASLSVFPRLGSATIDGRSAVKHPEPRQRRNTHTHLLKGMETVANCKCGPEGSRMGNSECQACS